MRRVSSQFSSILQRLITPPISGIEGAMVGVAFGDIEPAVGQIAEDVSRKNSEPQTGGRARTRARSRRRYRYSAPG